MIKNYRAFKKLVSIKMIQHLSIFIMILHKNIIISIQITHIKSIVLKSEYMSGAVEDNDEVSEALKKAAEEEAVLKGKESENK